MITSVVAGIVCGLGLVGSGVGQSNQLEIDRARYLAYVKGGGFVVDESRIPAEAVRRVDGELPKMFKGRFEEIEKGWTGRRLTDLKIDVLERRFRIRGQVVKVVDEGHRATFVFGDRMMEGVAPPEMLAEVRRRLFEFFQMVEFPEETIFQRFNEVEVEGPNYYRGSFLFGYRPSDSISGYESYSSIDKERWYSSVTFHVENDTLFLRFHYDRNDQVNSGQQIARSDPNYWKRFGN